MNKLTKEYWLDRINHEKNSPPGDWIDDPSEQDGGYESGCPDWINQTMAYLTVGHDLNGLSMNPFLEALNLPEDVMHGFERYRNWCLTERYFCGYAIAEAADLLLLPQVKDLAFESIRDAVESGTFNPDTDLPKSAREHFKNFNKTP